MDTGYDPGRIHSLMCHTLESIDRLDALTSPDPVAGDALRAVRLTRANLEDHWMPALREIERSAPMVRWRRSRLGGPGGLGRRSLSGLAESLPDHLRPGGLTAATIPSRRRDELLGRLDWLERTSVNGDAGPGAPTARELADLGDEVSYWVRRDDAFATELVELSTSNMTVARLLGAASFPAAFGSRIVQQMATPNGPDSGVDHDRYAASLSVALDSLADDPAACLDLLLDQPTIYALAAWDEVDPTSLGNFVASGLMDGVLADATRAVDGFEVVRTLVLATNGPLDDGMSAGMARGVALSMPVYFPQLSAGIFQTGSEPVRISEYGLTLGTYDEIANLFGSVMRDDDAAGALGVALGAFTDQQLTREGVDLTANGSLTDVVHLSLLLDHGARSEQAQLIVEATAEQARRDGLAGLLGAGAGIALTATGVGAAWRGAAVLAIRTVTNTIEDVDAEQLAGASIASRQYQQIWMSAMANALERPETLRAAQLDPAIGAQVAEFRERLDEIEACDDPLLRSELVIDLRAAAEGTVVDGYLDDVTASQGLPTIR
jgi:hypothetical protein